MEWVPINWRIIRHPANWVIVLLMVLMASFILDIANQWFANIKAQNGAAV